ncbi:MAG TPA: sialidase family protein [Verrucomicrobiae bacterium]|jgi:photosystem II stability/assembly factor-like uncharacterized protein
MKYFAAMAVLCGGLFLARETVADTSYQWRNVAIDGGGFVTGLIMHPGVKDLLYARTDVGGAYRWDATARCWIPLTDSFGGMDFTGIESLALDPNDTNRVYLAAGIYESTRAAIFRSDDQGRTWQETDVAFKMGGNESGRFNGERLAVDPEDGKILFFGSRRDGLWKSSDRGVTWTKVPGFPQVEQAPDTYGFGFGSTPVGIVCILFDKPAIYAAVSMTGTNLFRSDDGGNTWQGVPGQPIGLRPNHLVRASDGELYLSYGDNAGPSVMTDGAVWKFNPKSGAWAEITPLKSPDGGQAFGYGAVAVDAANPQVIVASTFCRWHPHDELFRSTNGGASWTPLLGGAHFDHSAAPYTASRIPHWMGSVVINPFDSNQAWFTTGYGVWCGTNLTMADAGRATDWIFADNGLEETVPLALISPPEGAHLLSGLGDIDGFRHDDLTVPPPTGSYSGPRFNSTESLVFAGNNSRVIARTGITKGQPRAAVSEDGGETWSLLPQYPNRGRSSGTIALSADGATLVLVPRPGGPCYITEAGTNWINCSGLSPGVRVAADAVNPARFYAFDARTGNVLASTNGARNFFEAGKTVQVEDGFWRGITLSATPGREGDLWLSLQEGGLYHSTDGGMSFVKVEPIQEAGAIGFGKAADGKTFPALYLAGAVGKVEGIYRSLDAGATWTQINDEQHQYGTISHITGDPRVFGRVYLATGGRGVIYGDERKE